MNRQQFSEFVKNPASANDQSLKILEELTKRYPYCQTGQILFTYNLLKENDLRYHPQLKKAAAYSGDRRKLKELIQSWNKPTEEKPVQKLPVTVSTVAETDQLAILVPEEKMPEMTDAAVSPLPVPEPEPVAQSVSPAQPEPVIPVPQPVEQPAAEVPKPERFSREELLAIVRKRLAEIGADSWGEPAESSETERESTPEQLPAGDLKLAGTISKSALIEKFIREEPKITPPKSSFFSPTESAVRSNMDEEEIVSETLAHLYARQGNIQKAIHIYEKLSLLNQEKSRYFAARIQELTTGRP